MSDEGGVVLYNAQDTQPMIVCLFKLLACGLDDSRYPKATKLNPEVVQFWDSHLEEDSEDKKEDAQTDMAIKGALDQARAVNARGDAMLVLRQSVAQAARLTEEEQDDVDATVAREAFRGVKRMVSVVSNEE